MYAVIETGGKQYKVAPNHRIQVEKLNISKGEVVDFPVLVFKPENDSLQLEPSALKSIKVKATVVDHIRGEKIRIVKFRRRKHHRKQMGHRQYHTVLQINAIEG